MVNETTMKEYDDFVKQFQKLVKYYHISTVIVCIVIFTVGFLFYDLTYAMLLMIIWFLSWNVAFSMVKIVQDIYRDTLKKPEK